MGMMPHPERASDALMGSTDGLTIFALDGPRGGGARMMASASPPTSSPSTSSPRPSTRRSSTSSAASPRYTELGIFSVMWSEHCSYKSSRIHLKKLPTRGKLRRAGAGRERRHHRHRRRLRRSRSRSSRTIIPSFIEPFQGAATGVGGILRDIFTMGARPIAVMDSLRFGRSTTRKQARATAASSTASSPASRITAIASASRPSAARAIFEPCYNGNPLVNVFALGVVEEGRNLLRQGGGRRQPRDLRRRARPAATGFTARPWRRAEFTEESKQKRPNVQVGDPFMEKLLLEACLEAMQTGAIVGIQDMGAAGLTCSTCEMGSRGGDGHRDRAGPRAAARDRHDALRDHALANRRSACCWWPTRAAKTKSSRVFRKWGLDAVDGRRRHRRRQAARPASRRSRRRDSESRAGRRSAAVRPAAHDADAHGVRWKPPRDCRSRTCRTRCRRCSLAPESAPSAGSGSSTTTRSAPTRSPGPGYDAAIIRIKETGHVDRDVARRQRPLLLSVAARRRETRCGRVLPQSFDGRARSRWPRPTA